MNSYLPARIQISRTNLRKQSTFSPDKNDTKADNVNFLSNKNQEIEMQNVELQNVVGYLLLQLRSEAIVTENLKGVRR